MKVLLNGDDVEVEQGCTLGTLVDTHTGTRRGVAVACNGVLVARSTWDEVALSGGDFVEVLGAAQGG